MIFSWYWCHFHSFWHNACLDRLDLPRTMSGRFLIRQICFFLFRHAIRGENCNEKQERGAAWSMVILMLFILHSYCWPLLPLLLCGGQRQMEICSRCSELITATLDFWFSLAQTAQACVVSTSIGLYLRPYSHLVEFVLSHCLFGFILRQVSSPADNR